jgi:hypothetical protein
MFSFVYLVQRRYRGWWVSQAIFKDPGDAEACAELMELDTYPMRVVRRLAIFAVLR